MRSRRWLLTLLAVPLLAGCSSRNIRAVPAAKPEAQHFVVLDKDARGKLVLQSARLDTLPDGRLKLTCNIVNRKDKNLWRPGFLWDILKGIGTLFVRKSSAQEGPEWADVKARWLDAQGTVAEETNWQATQFHRLMDTTLTFTSTTTGVQDYRVYMRTREHLR